MNKVKLIVERHIIDSTSSSKTWVVVKYDDGSWACSCPKWIFTRGQKENCKHIKELLFKQQEKEQMESTLIIDGIKEQMELNEVENENFR